MRLNIFSKAPDTRLMDCIFIVIKIFRLRMLNVNKIFKLSIQKNQHPLIQVIE